MDKRLGESEARVYILSYKGFSTTEILGRKYSQVLYCTVEEPSSPKNLAAGAIEARINLPDATISATIDDLFGAVGREPDTITREDLSRKYGSSFSENGIDLAQALSAPLGMRVRGFSVETVRNAYGADEYPCFEMPRPEHVGEALERLAVSVSERFAYDRTRHIVTYDGEMPSGAPGTFECGLARASSRR